MNTETLWRLIEEGATGGEAGEGSPDVATPEEPEYTRGIFRGLQIIAAPPASERRHRALDEARAEMDQMIADYLAREAPEPMLLVKAAAGVGKTTAAVKAAEALARAGKRVLYAGPRHAFFQDLLQIAAHRDWWYEWLPRQAGDAEQGKIETCRYVQEVNAWTQRGYRGIDFCRMACGWDVVNNSCPYHAQKRRREPIIFGQHQHVTLGHPLEFGAVIGDEQPVAAFCNPWRIPADGIEPDGLDYDDPLLELMAQLRRLAEAGTQVEGPDLLQLLGGPAEVLERCEDFILPVGATLLAPEIHSPGEAERVPYAHLPQLVPLLAREARRALAGEPYPHRIRVAGGALTLLLRHKTKETLPRSVVWLDATANEHLYRSCFQRPVETWDAQPKLRGRIFQVVDRANGISTLLKEGQPTAKVPQTVAQVEAIIARGYQRPAIISYQRLLEGEQALQRYPHCHFYAARGTNALEGADALILVGTPQPPRESLEPLAAMLYFERDTAFDASWLTRDLPYNYVDEEGYGRSYPASGFWADPDLSALLWSVREAEIIQAAHRGRPVHQPVDVWLLTNLPIWELAPDGLLSLHELFHAPEGVNCFAWAQAVEVAERCQNERGAVTTVDFVQSLGCDRRTASKYLDLLIQREGWQEIRAATRGPGRAPKAARYTP